jgi:arsenite transporter
LKNIKSTDARQGPRCREGRAARRAASTGACIHIAQRAGPDPQPLVIALLAVPILIQVYFNAGLAYLLNRLSGEEHCVAGPSALIGASNFFELAVAAAISLFGFQSGAALATVVGVLIEVPVMLSVVWIVNRSKDWYENAKVSGRVAGERGIR